jgi:hypothetical protein
MGDLLVQSPAPNKFFLVVALRASGNIELAREGPYDAPRS